MRVTLKRDKQLDPLRQKIEYRHTITLQWLTVLSISFFVGLLIFTVLFVYTRIQNTIGQVESIVLLQSELQVEFIDFEKLEQVKSAWEMKHGEQKPQVNRDPFHEPATRPLQNSHSIHTPQQRQNVLK